jgi:hypothetical protein
MSDWRDEHAIGKSLSLQSAKIREIRDFFITSLLIL